MVVFQWGIGWLVSTSSQLSQGEIWSESVNQPCCSSSVCRKRTRTFKNIHWIVNRHWILAEWGIGKWHWKWVSVPYWVTVSWWITVQAMLCQMLFSFFLLIVVSDLKQQNYGLIVKCLSLGDVQHIEQPCVWNALYTVNKTALPSLLTPCVSDPDWPGPLLCRSALPRGAGP